jgi:heme exporter protein A
MLTVNNLSYYKNQKKIFSSLGFSISLSSALIIKGQNGSGKTSLLKIIAGIAKQNDGEIFWDEQNIEDFRDDFNGDIQFIGHKNFFDQELTILENLKFYTSLEGSPILIPAALKFFQLEENMNKKMKYLSAGMQKRAVLSKLLTCQSTIWILDEPSSNLDLEGKTLLYQLIESKIKNGSLVILSSHDEMFFKLGQVLEIEDF